MLKLKNVSKTYASGAVKAVAGLNLTVNPGEIFGFIGPNGAGKTTTIKMICGILAPVEGSVEIGGHDIAKEPIEAKQMLGFVPDTHDVYSRLTGYEYLNFIADVYGVDGKARRERMERYLTMFSIKDAASDLIKSYSHGMRQKLMVAGALLPNPPLWILDEPMTGLDPKAALLLKEEMREHCRAGHTVFFSTHVLEVAERLCDRIGIISGGKLIAVGTMEELRGGGRSDLEGIFFELTEKGEA
ncbi:ABC transporter ATP-binding protein [Oscillospiraceae bacterium OttesenSCG-928-G22]|nr:ABC transporter ATP-binding protein [Oscillospiraceae bacterium OttesenSCG-928-G22]